MFNLFRSKKKAEKDSLKKQEKRTIFLVRKIKNGDTDAFSELYDIYINPIYKYVFLRISDPEEVQDLCQKIFLKVWNGRESFKEDQKGFFFTSWVFRITRNVIIDHYRTKKTNKISLDVKENFAKVSLVHKVDNEGIKNLERKSLNKTLISAVRKLPESERQIIVLKFIEGFNNKEISEISEKSQGAIRVLQFRALKKLSQLLSNKL
ncbi:hypothetical protein COY23_03620 [bacterium (Candidatus Torokbacteria) CG_4_10_14_0_2_um_filter_35_8]|nr:MAG: hypothetical protein COY23_03620 [bacterium (Candidatus Torokbacteria) CG_4_10_14_0_2_um_filter_35_8]